MNVITMYTRADEERYKRQLALRRKQQAFLKFAKIVTISILAIVLYIL